MTTYVEAAGTCGCTKKGAVLIRRPKPNHLLHLILTTITGGFWAILWFDLARKNRKEWLCSRCGSKDVELKEKSELNGLLLLGKALFLLGGCISILLLALMQFSNPITYIALGLTLAGFAICIKFMKKKA